MKQFRIVILLIAASLFLYACPIEKGHSNITFVNNSDKKVILQVLVSGSITEADTLFDCRVGARGVLPYSLYDYDSIHDSWENDFNILPYLQFLVLDGETYDQYIAEPCDTIRKYVPILHRYRLTLADLEEMNWTVMYP